MKNFKKMLALLLAVVVLAAALPISSLIIGAEDTTGNEVNVEDLGESKFSFLFTTDIHFQSGANQLNQFKKMYQDVKKTGVDIDAIFISGDLTQESKDTEWELLRKYIAAYSPDGVTTYTTMGNHDARSYDYDDETRTPEERWAEVWGYYQQHALDVFGMELEVPYYHVEINGYDLIVLCTETAERDSANITDTQVEWFRNKLAEIAAAKGTQNVIVMCHQPLASTHVAAGSAASHNVGTANDAIEEIIAQYPQVIYLSGHIHTGEEKLEVINDGKGIFLDGYAIMNYKACWYVDIYEDYVHVRARDFSTGSWIESRDYLVPAHKTTTVDKYMLRTTYWENYNYSGLKYSEESFAVYTAAVNEARAVLDNFDATQEEVDNAYNALVAGVKGLTRKTIKTAVSYDAMSITMLQDYASLSTAGIVSGSTAASATVSDVAYGVDAKGSLVLGSTTAKDSSAVYTIPLSSAIKADDAGYMVYAKLPAVGSNLKTNFAVTLVDADGNEIDTTGATVSYYDVTQHLWKTPATANYYAAGFEGYVKVIFAEGTDASAAKAVKVTAEQVGDTAKVVIGGIYSVQVDTKGATANIGGAEKFLVNGKVKTEEYMNIYKDAIKAETIVNFGALEVGTSIPDTGLGFITYNYTSDPLDQTITLTIGESINSVAKGNAIVLYADGNSYSFWEGSDCVMEISYNVFYYPQYYFLDDCQAILFYADAADYANEEGTGDGMFGLKFTLDTYNLSGERIYSDMGEGGTYYFLEDGTEEWVKGSSSTGSVKMLHGSSGYFLCPIESFKNGLAGDLTGRYLQNSTIIASEFGEAYGTVTIDGLWNVVDYELSNLFLLSYNGAETYSLLTGEEAVTADLDKVGTFPYEPDYIDALPEVSTEEYFILDPAYEDITGSTAKFTWDAFPGAGSYNISIYKSVYTDATLKYLLVTEAEVEEAAATVEGLDPLTWYFAVVTAKNSSGRNLAVYDYYQFQTEDAPVEDDSNTGTDTPAGDDNTGNNGSANKPGNDTPAGDDNNDDATPEIPATGDSSNAVGFAVVALLSFVLVLAALTMKKREEQC